MNLPKHKIPIVEIPIGKKVRLFIKREDLTHPEISKINIGKCLQCQKYLEKKVSGKEKSSILEVLSIILQQLQIWEKNLASKL